jgi:hypothetical protein
VQGRGFRPKVWEVEARGHGNQQHDREFEQRYGGPGHFEGREVVEFGVGRGGFRGRGLSGTRWKRTKGSRMVGNQGRARAPGSHCGGRGS